MAKGKRVHDDSSTTGLDLHRRYSSLAQVKQDLFPSVAAEESSAASASWEAIFERLPEGLSAAGNTTTR
jgi:hypothetical protein